jgi:uncharacterized protein involved in exopolysaccharide biosynthesis/Mrp family chromosome partitioning ATPase
MASPFIKRYLLALNRYKWAGLAGFLAVLGASGVVALQPKPEPTFYSQGVLVDNSPLVAFTITGPEVQQQGSGIINEELLLSDILLRQVSAELGKRGFQVTPEIIKSNTSVTIDGNEETGARQVIVRFIGPDPKVTEATLNILFQGMVELSRVTNKARLQSIMQALNERLPSIEGELRKAEQALEAYDRIEGPAIQAAIDGSLLNGISGSRQQFRDNLIQLAGIDAQMRSLEQQLGMSTGEAYVSSALSADPIIASLRAQIYDAETQIQLLRSSGYRDTHPAIVELARSLQAYNQLLQSRGGEVIGGNGTAPIATNGQIRLNSNLDPARAELANQLVTLKSQRDAIIQQQEVLRASAQQLRQEYAGLPNKQLERDRLAYQVALKKALYDQIQAKLVDAGAAEAETVSSLTVATPPFTKQDEQEAPNPIVVFLAGSIIGLVVGGGLIFLLDMLDGTIRTTEDLETVLRDQDVPILGSIPQMRYRTMNGAPILAQANSPYQDNYERFLSKLRLISSGNSPIGPRVVLITSTRDKEGKSVNAYNLAITAARTGRRTLLIEADLRSGSKARFLGITTDAQAQSEPLRYYGGQMGDAIRMVPFIENLYICPSPGPLRQAAAVLESSEMRRLLEDSRGRFDMVVLDAPALSRYDDALLLESYTDGMIVVTKPGVTEKAVLTTALEELDGNDDIRLLGAIVNGADITLSDEDGEDEPDEMEKDVIDIRSPAQQVPIGSQIDF